MSASGSAIAKPPPSVAASRAHPGIPSVRQVRLRAFRGRQGSGRSGQRRLDQLVDLATHQPVDSEDVAVVGLTPSVPVVSRHGEMESGGTGSRGRSGATISTSTAAGLGHWSVRLSDRWDHLDLQRMGPVLCHLEPGGAWIRGSLANRDRYRWPCPQSAGEMADQGSEGGVDSAVRCNAIDLNTGGKMFPPNGKAILRRLLLKLGASRFKSGYPPSGCGSCVDWPSQLRALLFHGTVKSTIPFRGGRSRDLRRGTCDLGHSAWKRRF